MQARSIGLLLGGIVVGVALAGLTATAVTGQGPTGWMDGRAMGHGMMGGGCHMCAGSSAGTSGSGTLVVMQGSQFQPTTLNVRVGDTVTWRNDDAVAHTVTSDAGSELDSPMLEPGETWTHTFTRAGAFEYHCTPHSAKGSDGEYSGMTGRVVVEA